MDTLMAKIKKIVAMREEMVERISSLKDEISMCTEELVDLSNHSARVKGEISMCTEELAMCEEVAVDLNKHLDYIKGEQILLVKAMAVAGAIRYLDSSFTDYDAYLYDEWEERVAAQ